MARTKRNDLGYTVNDGKAYRGKLEHDGPWDITPYKRGDRQHRKHGQIIINCDRCTLKTEHDVIEATNGTFIICAECGNETVKQSKEQERYDIRYMMNYYIDQEESR